MNNLVNISCVGKSCTNNDVDYSEDLNSVLKRVQRYLLANPHRFNNTGFLSDPNPSLLYKRLTLKPENIFIDNPTGPSNPLTKNWDTYKTDKKILFDPSVEDVLLKPNLEPEKPSQQPSDDFDIDLAILEYENLQSQLLQQNQKLLIDIELMKTKIHKVTAMDEIRTSGLSVLHEDNVASLLEQREIEKEQVRVNGVSLPKPKLSYHFEYQPSSQLIEWFKTIETLQRSDNPFITDHLPNISGPLLPITPSSIYPYQPHTSIEPSLPPLEVTSTENNTAIPIVPKIKTAQSTVTQSPITQPSIPQSPITQPSVPQSTITQPSIPQSPITQPSIPQSPITQPPVPQSTITQPSIPQSPITQPPVPQSTVTQSPISQPPVPQSTTTQPSIPQSPITQPSITQPSIPQPQITQPPVPQTTITLPSVPHPQITQPPVPQSTITQPSVPQSTIIQPQITQPPVPQTTITRSTISEHRTKPIYGTWINSSSVISVADMRKEFKKQSMKKH